MVTRIAGSKTLKMKEPILLHRLEVMGKSHFDFGYGASRGALTMATEPNQALEPTTLAVTIPAAQEVAPAKVVAHL